MINIAVLCPSEIAIRRFMPAVKNLPNLRYIGVGVNSIKERYSENLPDKPLIMEMLKVEDGKAKVFTDLYGGIIFRSYEEVISSPNVDALYIPLPPALHYKWAEKALKNKKHVLVEKPATTNLATTVDLIDIARSNGLALHENYMFTFHDQLKEINRIVNSGELGDVRLYRILFGFPLRAVNDFRYSRTLGGGALLDAGGYTIKYASYLLGETAKVVYAHLNNLEAFEVDMYGSGVLINDQGVTAQIAFGMDNEYKCELEVWGSKGTLTTGRVLTAPAGFVPTAKIVKGGKGETITLPADDAFGKSIRRFEECISDGKTRESNYGSLKRQAELVQMFMDLTKR